MLEFLKPTKDLDLEVSMVESVVLSLFTLQQLSEKYQLSRKSPVYMVPRGL